MRPSSQASPSSRAGKSAVGDEALEPMRSRGLASQFVLAGVGGNEVAMLLAAWRRLVSHYGYFSVAGHIRHLPKRSVGDVPSTELAAQHRSVSGPIGHGEIWLVHISENHGIA